MTLTVVRTVHPEPEGPLSLRLSAQYRALTAWLGGPGNSYDYVRVEIPVLFSTSGARRYRVEPEVLWTRQDLDDDNPWEVRRWSEPIAAFRCRAEAVAAAEGLLTAVTADYRWLLVGEDYLDAAEQRVSSLPELIRIAGTDWDPRD
ncbi:hypothetical protein E8D34_17100 [Nocardioides sp. GY 10113]|uniref:hypothetical protein n=1 Tax=Nocardioides sp. GY 10113 TaxID=2569761 RepID=UPI0010A94BE1|nr:hypothetical protein [Nocardioides sp. GY 10113]TIC82202.1 hypothetical protein E8D34_17100 [Nocardioides sp. GY 10113]